MKYTMIYLICSVACLNAAPIIDVVIPCHEKDTVTLDLCIQGIKNNCKNVRTVFVVSQKKLTDAATWVDESIFPFTKGKIQSILMKNAKGKPLLYPNRIGWIYQQLLKLYAASAIPDIADHILIIDADTIFLNRVKFIDEQGALLYNPGREYHAPYFVHAAKLIPGFKKVFSGLSGISHHMIFEKKALRDLFDLVQATHGSPFWHAFCCFINPFEASGAADYEIYFNFVFAGSYAVKVRRLKWANITRLSTIEQYRKQGYHYISCHSWSRVD